MPYIGKTPTPAPLTSADITDNIVGADELLVTGDGTTSEFLRSDGDGTFSWATPTDNDTTYSNFSGTTAGLVPTSTSSDDTKFLRADGTWVVPTDTDTDTDTTYSTASATTSGLIKLEDGTEQTVAANTVTTTASRTYGVQLNATGQAVVNVRPITTAVLDAGTV